jgi:predicted MFS family arabinose efflux permease
MTTIEQSYATRSAYPRITVLAAGLFVVGTNAFVIAGLLPDIAKAFRVSTATASYSITFYAIVVAIVAPAVSILLPRLSRTHLMAAGLLLLAIGTLVAAVSGSITVFTIGRLIAALGGAALVPAATAAAPALVSPEQRGKALAVVGVGFTLATAIGSPVGTALGEVGGWRLPLFILAGLALVLAVAVFFGVRNIPLGTSASFAQRLAPLRDSRIVLPLVTTLFMMAGFNIVYIFSSEVTGDATGGSGSLLAVLLLMFGLGGIVGTVVSGPLTDRVGSRLLVTLALGLEVVALVVLPFIGRTFVGAAIVFAIWGIAAFAATVPVQHRMVSIDPARAPLALSWYTTAMYIGIAIAPPLGTAAFHLGGATFVPYIGAIATLVGLIAFLVGYLSRRRLAVA